MRENEHKRDTKTLEEKKYIHARKKDSPTELHHLANMDSIKLEATMHTDSLIITNVFSCYYGDKTMTLTVVKCIKDGYSKSDLPLVGHSTCF